MSEDKKPDGYVAVYSKQEIEEPKNPDMGYCGTLNTGYQESFSTTENGAKKHLFRKCFGDYFDDGSKKDCAALRGLLKEGWRIRPVKLVFLDED